MFMKRVLLLIIAVVILFACNSGPQKQNSSIPDQAEAVSQDQTSSVSSSEQDSQGQIAEGIDDDEIPESVWTRNIYSGTMSGGGKTLNITMAISYPGDGTFNCPIICSYQYEGHNDLIALEGDWIELTDLYEQLPVLYSDEYLERFELEMNGEDLISSTVLKGTWNKYDNKKDYDFGDYPQKKLNVELKLVQ